MAVFVVRHAIAVGRSDWGHGDDVRPLTKRGERQATGLAELLGGHDVRRVRSSRARRCVDTVGPLAAARSLDVAADEMLFEGGGAKGALALAVAMAAEPGDTVLCSHGDVIPDLLRRLARHGTALPAELPCAKGSTWELVPDGDGRFATATYLPPAG